MVQRPEASCLACVDSWLQKTLTRNLGPILIMVIGTLLCILYDT